METTSIKEELEVKSVEIDDVKLEEDGEDNEDKDSDRESDELFVELEGNSEDDEANEEDSDKELANSQHLQFIASSSIAFFAV
jgi:hypothetical protein